MKYSIYVDKLINAGEETLHHVKLTINNGIIHSIEPNASFESCDHVFKNSICSPALINGHDHLKYTWIRTKKKESYTNSYEWVKDLRKSTEKQTFFSLTTEDTYWLGVYKSIFSGVVTVANHCRYLGNDSFSFLPIRVLTDFAREKFIRRDPDIHSMGGGIEWEIKYAKSYNIPLVVHIAEGVDSTTAEEIELLDKLGGLSSNSVLIHAINVSSKDIKKIANARASVVWCPSSNYFLFNKTTKISNLLENNINICLGTDSTSSGKGDLLQEMRFAVKDLEAFMSYREAAKLVFSFVTKNPAMAYKESQKHKKTAFLGMVAEGGSADLLIYEDQEKDPYTTLLEIKPEDIKLLLREGQILLNNSKIVSRMPYYLDVKSSVKINDSLSFVIGNPTKHVEYIRKESGIAKERLPLKFL